MTKQFNASIYYKGRMVMCDNWQHCSSCERNTPCGSIVMYWGKLKCCQRGEKICRDCIKNIKKYYSKIFVCPFCEREFLFKDVK
jgi:hypothetical protein